jgi:hypothetical protein
MTQPDPAVHIPGLITAAGTTTPPLPAAAQPGSALPPGTVTPGVIPPVPQVAAQGANVPALPQAGSVLPPVQVDPAVAAAYLASMQSQPPAAQPVAPVAPAPVAAPAPQPVLPTTVVPQPPAPVAVPGLAAPVAVPPAQPAAPAAPPAAQPPASATEPDGLTDGDGKDYPEGKPLAEMTDAERASYYKWYSRQHENRAKASKTELDALRAQLAQGQTPAVPAPAQATTPTDLDARIAAAIQEGYQQAAAAAAVTLVDAHVRAGLQSRLQPHQVEALASGLNHAHFLGADGRSVDADKVATFVNTVAPAPTPATAVPAVTASPAPATPGALPTSVPVPGQPVTGLPRPDLGQGVQPAAPLDKFELGRQQARAFLAGNL